MIYPARSLLIAAFLSMMVLCVGGAARAQIVAIGASDVAGRGVSPSDAWPAQLQGMLARLDSAVPEGTKIVLLDRYGGGWNGRRLGQGSQSAELAAIEAKLRSRGIRVIPMWWSGALRKYMQADGIHFTPEGHRLVATNMLPAVASAVR